MKRLARVNGNVRAIITGDEQVNCKEINGKMQYPVNFFGEPDYVPVIIKNGNHFYLTVGQTTDNLEDWNF
jgi:hypothetical protein